MRPLSLVEVNQAILAWSYMGQMVGAEAGAAQKSIGSATNDIILKSL
jgi:hypothetical protein